MSEVVKKVHDINLLVGCHAIICVEIRLGHWMWDLVDWGGRLERKIRQPDQARPCTKMNHYFLGYCEMLRTMQVLLKFVKPTVNINNKVLSYYLLFQASLLR